MNKILREIRKLLATLGLIGIGLTTIISYSMYGALPTDVLVMIIGGTIAGLTYTHTNRNDKNE